MAIIVGFISEKGGVGKTTACYHIAEGLSRFHSKKILVIDADYQRGGITGRYFPQAIEHFGRKTPTGITLFNKYQQLYSATAQSVDIDISKFNDNIDVIPADYRLATVSTDKLPSSNNIRSNNAVLLQHLKTIQFIVESVEDEYDYVLIDSHPEVSDIMRSIIYASDYCVSPVKFDRQSSIGVATVIGEIENVNDDIEMLRRSLSVGDDFYPTEFAGAMGMMAREWGEELIQTEQLEYNRLRQAGHVFENYITEGDGIRQAAALRLSVYDVALSNAYKQAEQFKKLTTEFIRVCK